MFFAEKEICPGQACGWWAVVGANNCAVTDTSAMHNRVSQFFLEFCNLFCAIAAYSCVEPPQKFSSLKTNQKKKRQHFFQMIALSQAQVQFTLGCPNFFWNFVTFSVPELRTHV